MKKPAQPPFRGVSNNSAFYNAGFPFAPPSSMSNMLVFDLVKGLPRMGSRHGTSEYFYGTFGAGGPVRGCGTVSRGKTPSGYALGQGTDLINTDGSGHLQQAVTGNIWRVDSSWGLTRYAAEDVTGDGGAGSLTVPLIAVSPDQTKLIVGETYTTGGNTVGRVTCRDSTTLAVLWTKKLATASQDRFVSAICINADWVFVATNHFVRIYKLADGTDPLTGNSLHGLNSWSTICKDVKVSEDGNAMYALFLGSPGGTTLPSGVIVTAGIYAQHFRSGIMKFTVATPAQLAAGAASNVLTQTAFSPQLNTNGSARYYEGNGTTKHNYLRFSEQMPWAPRGMSPVAMVLRPQGGIAVIHANAAWGPNGTFGNADYFPPDGTAGRWNLTAFTSTGIYEWRADGDSIFTEDGGAGFFNDLLSSTARCISVDSAGNIFHAGRRTKPVGDADGTSVWAWDRYGQFVADADLGGTVNGLCVMPSSQVVVAATDRNHDYPTASGVNCQLFQLANGDLALRRRFPDLGNHAAKQCVGIGFTGPVQPNEDRDALAFCTEFV